MRFKRILWICAFFAAGLFAACNGGSSEEVATRPARTKSTVIAASKTATVTATDSLTPTATVQLTPIPTQPTAVSTEVPTTAPTIPPTQQPTPSTTHFEGLCIAFDYPSSWYLTKDKLSANSEGSAEIQNFVLDDPNLIGLPAGGVRISFFVNRFITVDRSTSPENEIPITIDAIETKALINIDRFSIASVYISFDAGSNPLPMDYLFNVTATNQTDAETHLQILTTIKLKCRD